MFFELISMIFGILKILLYKCLYPFRISFSGIPKINKSFKIAIKKKSKLTIGGNFRARNNVSFRVYNSGKLIIEDNCFMNDNCAINCQECIEIGNNVIFGQNVLVFDHDHDYKNDINKYKRKKVKIGNNVWIGANCIILKGVSIGDNVVVAAGSIINENIPNNSIVYQQKNTIAKKINRGE